MLIANTEKYLQFDWLRGVQYLPFLYSVFNIRTLEREKSNIRFFYHNIRIIEKILRHTLRKSNIYKSNKIGSKKMERFSATVLIEELKAKAKNTNTTKIHASGCLYIFLGRKLETKNKKLKGWSLADWMRFYYSSFIQKWKGEMTLTAKHHLLQIYKLL